MLVKNVHHCSAIELPVVSSNFIESVTFHGVRTLSLYLSAAARCKRRDCKREEILLDFLVTDARTTNHMTPIIQTQLSLLIVFPSHNDG